MSGHIQYVQTPVNIKATGEKIKQNMIKAEVKEEPISSPYTKEMDTNPFICIELVKSEVLEDKKDVQDVHMLDIESKGFIDEGDIKREVSEEAIDIVKHEFTHEDVHHEESEGEERYQLIEIEGAASIKQTQPDKVKDERISAPGIKKIPDGSTTQKTVTVLSSNIISTHMLNTETTEINPQVSINTSMYEDPAINEDNLNINSDNYGTNTNRNVDNIHLKMSISNNGDNKYLTIEHIDHNKSNRESSQSEKDIVNTDYIQEKRYICEICQRNFSTANHLNRHLRTHNREMLECEICNVKFKYKNILMVHLRSHTGEKPFECEMCQRKFNRADNLKRHLRGHNGVKRSNVKYAKSRLKAS